jgi:serine/threonine protein kinase
VAWYSRKRAVSARSVSEVRQPRLLAGRYRLGALIGGSAAASVREAIDLRSGITVAIKLITVSLELSALERAEWIGRFKREVELGRRLQHPDIVAVHGAQAWLVMDRVRGTDLSRYADPRRLLPEALVLRIGARVGAALAFAHAKGVVHRDLKPSNVLIDLGSGQLKLADFGVAKLDDAELTRTGMTLGTPAYMAPELLAGAPANGPSDAYALGVMLFELLTGRRPHQAATLGELLQATAREPPASLAELRPDLPAPVVLAVEQLLARDADQRPRDVAVWAAHAAALATLMTKVLTPSNPPRM